MPPRARPGHIRPRNALTSSISSRRPLTEYTASRARVSAGGNPSASVHSRGILIDVPSRSRTSRRLPRSVKTSSCCPSRGWCRRITVIWGGENRRWYAVCDSVPVLIKAAIQVPPHLLVDKTPPETVPAFEALLPLPPHLVVQRIEKAVQGCRARVPRPVQATRLCGQDDAPCLPQRGGTSPACPHFDQRASAPAASFAAASATEKP